MSNKIIYGFQDHMDEEFPLQIVVDVTEHCNLACVHCAHEEFIRTSAFVGRFLDPELNKKLVDEISTDGKGYCKFIRYTAQGEPLMHPKFVKLIEYAEKFAGVQINVTTNGILLDESTAKKLLDAGVDVFDISIDAYLPETYSKIRRKGDLLITRHNVIRLIELINTHKYNAKVVVSFIEQPLNKGEASLFERYWKNMGAQYVVIRKLHSCAGAKEEIARSMKEEIINRKPCRYPWERIVLSATGQIGFCPADWLYKAKITYFRDTTIKKVWQGEFMNSLRTAHMQNDFSKHTFCGQCIDWTVIDWPGEGRSYSSMMEEFRTLK